MNKIQILIIAIFSITSLLSVSCNKDSEKTTVRPEPVKVPPPEKVRPAPEPKPVKVNIIKKKPITQSSDLIKRIQYSGKMVKTDKFCHQNGDFFLCMSGHTTPESSWQKIRNMVMATWDAKKSDIHKDLLLTHGFYFSARKGVLSKCKVRSTVYGGLTPVFKPSTHEEIDMVWIEYPIDSSMIELVFECGKNEFGFKIEITPALKSQLLVIHEDIKKLIGAASENTKKMEDLLDRTFPITPLATDGSVSKNVKKIIKLRNATMVASFVLTMLDWQLNSLEKKKIAPTIFKIKLKRFAEKEYKYSRTKLVLIRRYIELAIKTNKKTCLKLRNRLKTMKNTEYEYGRLSRKYGHHCVIYDAAEKDLFEISPLFEFIEKRRKGWIKFEF